MQPTLTRLDDRYHAESGTFYMTGVQAIIRLLVDQHRLDARQGKHTATFVSGYEGSPLGGVDLEILRHPELMDEHEVVFRPGVNEELAATAVQGTQLAPSVGPLRYDGVVGFWYGKSPGLDRAVDALRHANLMGTSPLGGAVALVGDDPAAKSSTLPGASEATLAGLGMPTLYPSDPADVLRLGIHAVAMSRASGLWSAMKIVTNVADGGATVRLDPVEPVLPDRTVDGRPFAHRPTAHVVQPNLTPLEASQWGVRLEIARRYARVNGLNRVTSGSADRVGLVAAGKTARDVREALARMGLDRVERERRGIRLLELSMVWPLDAELVRSFAKGLDEVVIVEEKRPFIEPQLKSILYGLPGVPRITGKEGHDGGPRLFPMEGELGPEEIEVVLGRVPRIATDAQGSPSAGRSGASGRRRTLPLAATARTPYFCSGCPHNTSTVVPEGALVGGGIGCHALTLIMDEAQVGVVTGTTQMGGEGAQWVGMAPFLEQDHLFQNIGDGTFFHSGSLAVRMAVASGVNITYKLLFNSAVAMTGGQQAVGLSSLADVCRMLFAEGVARIVVTTDDVRRTRRERLPRGVAVRPREDILGVQTELASVPGVTFLIHEQECATELRRKRKRGKAPDPAERVIINERVCEGCGDCGRVSNCLSVQPVQTEFGRKTRIDQGSCNKDYSCLDGDCPSFVTVVPATGGEPTRQDPAPIEANSLPDPTPSAGAERFEVRVMGIGGTGVVTLAQVVGTAAALDGWHVRTLDQTGLAQKGGAVVSDVIMSRTPLDGVNKLTSGAADLYLGCDLLVAAQDTNLRVSSVERTFGVVSTSEVATGQMVVDPSNTFPAAERVAADLRTAMGTGRLELLDARALSTRLFGDDRYANVLLLGVAHQHGALPVPASRIEEALTLNGVAVEDNLQSFRRGRLYVSDRAEFDRAVGPSSPGTADGSRSSRIRSRTASAADRISKGVNAPDGSDLARLVGQRVSDLVDFQDVRYAQRYATFVEQVRAREASALPGSTVLAEAVARQLHKLMAYKDEYEVARLSLDPGFLGQISDTYGSGSTVAYRLHPPMLRTLGMDRKISLRRSARPVFALLRAVRRLRGTPFDPFGRAGLRRLERALIDEYQDTVTAALEPLGTDTLRLAVEIAGLPDMIRGYEQIKVDNVARYRAAVEVRMAELQTHGAGPPVAPSRLGLG